MMTMVRMVVEEYNKNNNKKKEIGKNARRRKLPLANG